MIDINDQVRQFMTTYIPYIHMYVDMININDHERQFMTTYIPHTPMNVVMIKNINDNVLFVKHSSYMR